MRTSWKGGPTRWVPGSTSTRCGSWYGPATPRTTRRSRCAWPPHWRPSECPRRPPSTWSKTRSIRAARRATCSIFPASFRRASRTARPPRRRRATEGYWSGKLPRADLLKTGAELRAAHWQAQRDAGLDLIPSNDFSYYDRVLDTCALVGAVPTRYGWSGEGPVDLDTYFAMARGVQAAGRDVTAMEMTKWFDTNYHYIVPEFDRGQAFRLSAGKLVEEFQEAKALGVHTKPNLIGPVTFLLLGKTRGPRFDRFELLDALLPVYAEALSRLAAAGAAWGQL